MGMKNAVLMLAMIAMAAGCTSTANDTEITPQWAQATSDEALGVWVAEVQGAIDSWQAVLGEGCAFPLWIGPNGPPVALVSANDWPYPGTLGMYNPDDGNILVLGNSPRRDGTTSTLAHELGHAVGLEHSNNRYSIMSVDAELTDVPTMVDGDALRQLLGCSAR